MIDVFRRLWYFEKRSVISLRMRKRANLDARMERCAALLADDPAALRGHWLERFPGHEGIFLELGCGKGRFTAELAAAVPNMLYLALEKVPDAMILAMEKIDRQDLQNVRFIDADAKLLNTMFAPGELDRIYINFCDPWPKSRDAKLRLTAPSFLRLYADALKAGGEIHFKTDNTPLFDWSIEQFTAEGWRLSELTHDLHANGPVGVMTDYEAKFYEQGMKINRLVATKTADTKGTAAGAVPRLRNASLTDARGYEESQEANRRNET
jgi:tRNA (guanine-N7-)-methyltransferase